MGNGRFIVGPGGGPPQPYEGKLTLSLFMACAMAACSGFLFGYDIRVSGGVSSMDAFFEKFFPHAYHVHNYCKFFGLVGSLSSSYTTRSVGRKASFLIGGLIFLMGGLIFLIGAVLNIFALKLGMLIGGRLLLGLGIGFGIQSSPLYLSEMSPPKHRAALSICFQLLITVAIFAANVVNYFTDKIHGGNGWRWSLGIAMASDVVMILGSLLLPDTPNSLIQRGRNEEALATLRKIRGTQNVAAEYQVIVAASEAAKQISHPWRALLRRSNRPHLCMAVMVPFFQQLTGINVVMFYQPVLFKTLGLGSGASLLSSAVSGLVNVLATFVSIAIVDRFGRRFLFLEGGIQMLLSQVLVGVLLWYGFSASGTGVISQSYALAVLVAICVYVSAYAWSWGPLGWLVPSETFPLELRSAGQSVVGSVNLLMTLVVVQVFQPMLCAFKFRLFFVLAAFVAAMTLYVWLFVPETKNIPIEEMQKVYREHWFWRRFVDGSEVYPPEELHGDMNSSYI